MKRTHLLIDHSLLEEAMRLSGEPTHAAVVNRALADFVRRMKARKFLDLAGSGAWEGNLSVMRRDIE